MTTVDQFHCGDLFGLAFAIGVGLSEQVVAQVTLMPRVIVETDMGGDVDDTALVAFMNHLADTGKIELLAVMHNGNNEWGGAAISAVNTYYGRPEIPIGTYRTAAEAGRPAYHPPIDPAQPNGPRQALSYVGTTPHGHWVRLLAENFPCHYRTRLEFPDAVDVYASVLQDVPNGSVVIVNGGFLGNLSNLVAHFDVDPALAQLFRSKVHRMTGAVGGVNTCASEFPSGMAEHVLENLQHETALGTSLGLPVLNIVATHTTEELADSLPLDHPVREAYRFKTEVEHGHRGTSLAWDWHIIDVLTAFSTIAWDDMSSDPGGAPFFDLHQPGWLDVHHNCGATIRTDIPAPAPHLEFQSVGAHVAAGETVVVASQRLREEFFENGLYVPPANPWSTHREHRSVTALFEDGTFGGLDFNGGNSAIHVAGGKLVVPTSQIAEYAGADLIVESRRYFDQTFVVRIGRVPAVDQQSQSATSQVDVDFFFWGDGRGDTNWGNAPLVRVVGWRGRGPGSAGLGEYRCEVWEAQSSGYVRVMDAPVPGVAVGSPFTLRVEVAGSNVHASIDGVPLFVAPIALHSTPPIDGGLSQLRLRATSVFEHFEVDYALLRPSAGLDTSVDVHIDKQGKLWFSYVKNGDLFQDMFGELDGVMSHFVDVQLVPDPGLVAGDPFRMRWFDWDPTTFDWLHVVPHAHWEAVGSDHWVYGINAPLDAGDEIHLEFRGRREGEKVPFDVNR